MALLGPEGVNQVSRITPVTLDLRQIFIEAHGRNAGPDREAGLRALNRRLVEFGLGIRRKDGPR